MVNQRRGKRTVSGGRGAIRGNQRGSGAVRTIGNLALRGARTLTKEGAKRIFEKRKDIAEGHGEIIRRQQQEKKEVQEIHKRLLKLMGNRRLQKDRRAYALAVVLQKTLGKKVIANPLLLKTVNGILSKELRNGSPIVERSLTLKKTIEKIKDGKVKDEQLAVLEKAVTDILQNYGIS